MLLRNRYLNYRNALDNLIRAFNELSKECKTEYMIDRVNCISFNHLEGIAQAFNKQLKAEVEKDILFSKLEDDLKRHEFECWEDVDSLMKQYNFFSLHGNGIIETYCHQDDGDIKVEVEAIFLPNALLDVERVSLVQWGV